MKSNPDEYYDEMGEAYIRKSESGIYNAYYNIPAIKSLLSEVDNKRVLEIGCGGGV